MLKLRKKIAQLSPLGVLSEGIVLPQGLITVRTPEGVCLLTEGIGRGDVLSPRHDRTGADRDCPGGGAGTDRQLVGVPRDGRNSEAGGQSAV